MLNSFFYVARDRFFIESSIKIEEMCVLSIQFFIEANFFFWYYLNLFFTQMSQLNLKIRMLTPVPAQMVKIHGCVELLVKISINATKNMPKNMPQKNSQAKNHVIQMTFFFRNSQNLSIKWRTNFASCWLS